MSFILRLVGGNKLVAWAVVALFVTGAALGTYTLIRTDAAQDALAGAYKRFNEGRIADLIFNKEVQNDLDQIRADCLADAALNGLREADCPAAGD